LPEAPLRGLWTGEGVYETLLWRGVPPPGWPLHVARMREGAARLGLPLPEEETLLRAAQAVGPGLWRLRLTWLAVGGAWTEAPQRASLLCEARGVTPGELAPPPARLVLGGCVRNPASRLAGCKRTGIAEDLVWRRQAERAGADDTLLRSVDGWLSEASTSTLLCGLDDGSLASPGPDAAPVLGTTLAQLQNRLPIAPLRLTAGDLGRIRWALLLNAVVGARAVAVIEDQVLDPPPAELCDLARATTGWPEFRG